MTRRAHYVETFDGLADFASRVAGLYRSDVWGDHGQRVEVWLESRSMVGAVDRLCKELAVDLFPCGGQPSETFVHEAARAIDVGGLPTSIFYVGDFDGPGLVIARSVERKLRAFAPAAEIRWRHLGVNEAMIARYDLPTRPHKTTRLREAPTVAVEAEALPANEWRRILRREIEALLPAGAFEAARIAEEDERHSLLEMAGVRP